MKKAAPATANTASGTATPTLTFIPVLSSALAGGFGSGGGGLGVAGPVTLWMVLLDIELTGDEVDVELDGVAVSLVVPVPVLATGAVTAACTMSPLSSKNTQHVRSRSTADRCCSTNSRPITV